MISHFSTNLFFYCKKMVAKSIVWHKYDINSAVNSEFSLQSACSVWIMVQRVFLCHWLYDDLLEMFECG